MKSYNKRLMQVSGHPESLTMMYEVLCPEATLITIMSGENTGNAAKLNIKLIII